VKGTQNNQQDAQKGDLLTRPTWRAKTRLFPGKAGVTTASSGGWDDPNCARPPRGVRARALRAHGDRPSHPALFFSVLLD